MCCAVEFLLATDHGVVPAAQAQAVHQTQSDLDDEAQKTSMSTTRNMSVCCFRGHTHPFRPLLHASCGVSTTTRLVRKAIAGPSLLGSQDSRCWPTPGPSVRAPVPGPKGLETLRFRRRKEASLFLFATRSWHRSAPVPRARRGVGFATCWVEKDRSRWMEGPSLFN